MNSPLSEIQGILATLEDSGAAFSLARPLRLGAPVKDIDLLMAEDQVEILLQHLRKTEQLFQVFRPCSSHTIWIRYKNTLLDVRTCLAFLPFKTLILPLPLPAGTGWHMVEEYLVPDMNQSLLFSLWSLHLLLDKGAPAQSSGFDFYCHYYTDNWQTLIDDKEVQTVFNSLLESHACNAIERLKTGFSSGWTLRNQSEIAGFKRYFLIRRPALLIGHLYRQFLCLIEERISGREF